jgi:hypothetical protein
VALYQLTANHTYLNNCVKEWEITCATTGVDTGDAIQDLNAAIAVLERLMGILKEELEEK